MPPLLKPLNIGANDLLRLEEYAHCGLIHVQHDTLFGKRWKQRYGIISQGFLYIYTNRNAKKPDCPYPLKQFDSAGECDPADGEDICFCLRYKNAQAPILFSCDTPDSRDKWIENFNSAISEVQSVSYNLSADSAYGSAETVPRNKSKGSYSIDEYANYDEVDEWKFRDSKAIYSPVQACDDDSDYLSPKQSSRSNNTNKCDFYENLEERQTDMTRKVQNGVNPSTLIDELNLKVGRKHNTTRTTTSSLNTRTPAKEKSLPMAKSSSTQSSFFGQGLMPPDACSVSSFMSIRGEGSCLEIEESLPHLSVRGQESLYKNRDDTDNSSDSDNPSSETIYENPEKIESVKARKFKRKNYMCIGKKEATKELKQKPVGVFAVFPGDSAGLRLCVVTPLGLKYFRIHSQNERVSLFEWHQSDTFGSLDELLAFYHDNELPRKDYSVKLERGYNIL